MKKITKTAKINLNSKKDLNLSILNPFFNFELGLSSIAEAKIFIVGSANKNQQKKQVKEIVEKYALAFQKTQLVDSDKKVLHFMTNEGPAWILQNQEAVKQGHYGAMDESCYGFFRDQMGAICSQVKFFKEVQIWMTQANENIVRACVVGFELAAYQFSDVYKGKTHSFAKIFIKSDKTLKKSLLDQAQVEAVATQLARHLVNLPPNELNPESVQKLAESIKFPKTMKVNVWDQDRLQKENMGLHLAVGMGSKTPSRMVHFKYRPGKSLSKKPIAFVGKGVTFDTGGLDIKPSSAMRLMKKDMGGSAAVFALAYWCAFSNYHRPCDFYLALAENSVDAKAMRPSDVYPSRAGYTVEIDNTDAEGRLVLADVIDVAVTQTGKDEPEILVDVATLTGAIKVALGADVAGIFSNDDKLAESMTMAGQQAGEPNWRIPLVKKYFAGLSSQFADFKNSADGFGGAITAALFLEKFVRNKKWIHMDVYCWNDKSTGALSFAGGSGQPVQTLIEWLKGR